MKKNIKIFLIPIIAIVMLLVVQAFCDLALPEYTSSIINDGIGHNGITNEIPEVLPEDIFNAILKISNNDLTIKNSYILVAKENLNEKDFNHYAKKYPILKNEIVYILDDLTDDELNELKDKIREPLIISTMFKYNSNEIKGMLNLNEDDLLNWLMNTDAYTFEAVLTQAKNSLGNLDQSLLSEYSVASIKEIYEDVGININDYQMSYIISTGLKMLSIAFLGLMVAIILSYLISKLSSNVSYVLRNKVVNKIMSFSTGEFKEFGASSLITRSTNDIEQVRMFFNMFLRIVIFAPIMGIGAFIKVYDNPLNWLIAIALILILVLISILFALVMPKFKRMQKIIDKMNLVSREIITGMPVIRTFHTEEYEEKRFDKANNTLTKTNLFVNRVMNVMMPSMMLVMNLLAFL